MAENVPRKIQFYISPDGRVPFAEWFEALKSKSAQAAVDKALDKVRLGNLSSKNSKPLGSGVYEVKIDYGPGYRIYFGQVGLSVVLLLCGGDKRNKRTQSQDIQKAKSYWADYEKREGTYE